MSRQARQAVLNIFINKFNDLLNFCVYILAEFLIIQRLNKHRGRAIFFDLFVQRPVNNAVFSIAFEHYFRYHPPLNRHARRDNTIGVA